MAENVLTVNDYVWVTAVADGQTPPEYQQYNGRIIGLPQSHFRPNETQLLGVPGVYVQNSGTGGWSFLMGARDTAGPVLEAVPGPGGWTLPASRDVYASIGAALLAKGFTLQETGSGLAQLYAAAVADAAA
jgi:hypothetical protein